MAYDEDLAHRIRALVGVAAAGSSEKRMFGGLAFLVNGNMAIAASSKGGIMVRVPPELNDELVTRPDAAPMEMRGHGMKGWVRITAEGVESDDVLAESGPRSASTTRPACRPSRRRADAGSRKVQDGSDVLPPGSAARGRGSCSPWVRARRPRRRC